VQKFRLKIPYHYREIVKNNEMISLSYDVNDHAAKIKIHSTFVRICQYRSYTDFDIKLDGFSYMDTGLKFWLITKLGEA